MKKETNSKRIQAKIHIPERIRTAFLKADMGDPFYCELFMDILHIPMLGVNLILFSLVGRFKLDIDAIIILLQVIQIFAIITFAIVLVYEIFRLFRVEEFRELLLCILGIFFASIQIVIAILFLHFL